MTNKMMMRGVFAASVLLGGVAHAAPFQNFATDVWWVSKQGDVLSDKTRMLGGDLSTQHALELTSQPPTDPEVDVAFAVFRFLLPFKDFVQVWNNTEPCDPGSNIVCTNSSEKVQVLVGDDFDFSRPQEAGQRAAAYLDVVSDFTSLGTVGNAQAQPPGGVVVGIPSDAVYRYVALVDRSFDASYPYSGDGFDVAAVLTAAVPVPATLPLLAGALAGVLAVGRRRRPALAAD